MPMTPFMLIALLGLRSSAPWLQSWHETQLSVLDKSDIRSVPVADGIKPLVRTRQSVGHEER
jgi:hypothetical protein